MESMIDVFEKFREGSSRSTDSSNSNGCTVALAERATRTPYYLSDVSDILTPRRLIAPTRHAREGAQRLRQILQMGRPLIQIGHLWTC
ncbi:hypothetical protein TIFTF001_044750 [Ficus carica]|uniref:Uncharacterized protein n=1 Tax=Ficus carica TaxID=3494 RepID=A0AA88CWC7_FICCA|nr:hypothetical protein TIFTF001_044750 [Ficus carica]